MSVIVWWTVAVAIVAGTVGVYVGHLLAVADRLDDHESIERWERCRRHIPGGHRG